MPLKLTHIQRFRFSEETAHKLNSLKMYGVSKSKFVREAIDEKIAKEYPNIIEKKRKPKLPF